MSWFTRLVSGLLTDNTRNRLSASIRGIGWALAARANRVTSRTKKIEEKCRIQGRKSKHRTNATGKPIELVNGDRPASKIMDAIKLKTFFRLNSYPECRKGIFLISGY